MTTTINSWQLVDRAKHILWLITKKAFDCCAFRIQMTFKIFSFQYFSSMNIIVALVKCWLENIHRCFIWIETEERFTCILSVIYSYQQLKHLTFFTFASFITQFTYMTYSINKYKASLGPSVSICDSNHTKLTQK